jgi:hypothetical protein
MKNTIKAYEAVIAKAVKEAGINENEKYNVTITGIEGSLISFVIDTEWNKVTCYADTDTKEVVGIMAEAKMIEEILWGPASVVAAASANSRKAA